MWSLYTISTFYKNCVICQTRVSAGCLCRALVSASCVLPAGLMARWVSDCVVRAWWAPSVLCKDPLMGSKPQRRKSWELDHRVDVLRAELRHSHTFVFSAHANPTQVREGICTASCVAEGMCKYAAICVIFYTCPEETDLSAGILFYGLTKKLTKANVILFNKLDADMILYHFRQAVQEGYITEAVFFLPCHVEI